MTQIGIMIEGQSGLTWNRWARVLETAENAGYQCVFRSDHFTDAEGPDRESLELWVSLTYAASHTERIEFGPLVTPVTFRHPSMTARYAAAVDDLSNGRLILGMGAGWQEREHVKFGVPFYDFPLRYNMLTDALEVVSRLLHSDDPITYGGDHFALHDAVLLPRPQRTGGPPILIGGNGPKRTLPMVAKYADEWNAVFIDRETYKERASILDRYLQGQERQPEDVKRSLMTRVVYGETDADVQARLEHSGEDVDALRERGCIIGTPAQVTDEIGAWAEAGVERFMLQWLELDDIDGLESMAAKVLPHFHNGS